MRISAAFRACYSTSGCGVDCCNGSHSCCKYVSAHAPAISIGNVEVIRVELRWRRFGKFNLVGLLGAALEVSLLWMFTQCFRVPLVAATLAAVKLWCYTTLVAWHERFTWRDRRFQTVQRGVIALLLLHAGNGCISLAGNTLLMYVIAVRLGVPVLPSAGSAIAICSVLNFVLADRWVFSTRPMKRNCC